MALPRHLARSLCLGALLAAGAAPAAEDAATIQLGRERLLKHFDFEEADDQNFEDMPKNWYVIGRPDQTANPNFNNKPLHRAMIQRDGFPRHSVVRFNLPQEQKGDHNLQLGTTGASAGAFLEVGALAAVPGSDYLVTARIKTDRLRYSKARLIAYFVDAEGRRIDASAVATDLLNTSGQWQNISLRLSGDHPNAAWIGMQAELLQWQHQTAIHAENEAEAAAPSAPGPGAAASAATFAAPPTTHKHTVKYQDTEGAAWFDDIAVWQPPRIVVRTQSAANLVTGPNKPVLDVQVRDLSGQRLAATLNVFDHRGQRIAEVTRPVGSGELSQWQWSPPLPKYGWYLIDMTVRDPAQPADSAAPPVARTIRSLLWLPPRAAGNVHQFRKFTLDAHGASLDELKLVPQITAATGLSSVLVSAFERDGSLATLETRLAGLDAIFQPVWKQNGSVTVTLSPIPSELTDRLDVSPLGPVWLLARDAKDWSPLIAPLMLRHGQNVRRWQLGYTVDGALESKSLPTAVTAAASALRELSPSPRVVVPWPIETPRRAELDKVEVDFALVVPASIQPAKLAEYLSDWQRPPKRSVAVTLQVPSALELDHPRRVDDLAMRVLHAWEAGVDGVTIDQPWATAADPKSALHPDPLLGVFATVAHQLGGRRAVGRLSFGANQHAMILTGERGPLLAAWLDGSPDDRGEAALDLGGSPRASDIWGNRVELSQVDGRHVIPLTSAPIFIEGIDAELALLRASVSVTPKMIESSQRMHEHELTIKNPWTHPLHGELVIVSPGRDWRIEPRKINVSIDPGQSMSYPVRLAFPVAELAGTKELVAKLTFASGTRPPVELTAPMELGLPGIELETGLSVTPGKTGGSVVRVTAVVTNVGETPRTLYLFGLAAGQARQERILTVKPGQSLIRRFQFESASRELTASPIRIGLRDTVGPAVMNHVLKFE